MKTKKIIRAAIALGILTITIQPISPLCHFSEASNNTNEKQESDTMTVYADNYAVKGDGTDQSYALQKMFDTLNTNKGYKKIIVKFKNGHYKSSKRITIYDNMTIEGEGDNVIFTNTERQPFFVTGFTSDHSTYEKVKKDYSENAASNVKISNIIFKNSRVIAMNHSKNVQLEKLKVIDQPNGNAIEISASESVLINNCTFEGMNLNDADDNIKGCELNKAIQFSQCTKEDFPYFGAYNSNKKTYYNKNITISNCSFKKSDNGHSYTIAIGGHGDHKNNTTGHENITIKNCKIDGTTRAAITIPSVTSIVLENNKISNTPIGFQYLNNDDKHETKSIQVLANEFNNVDIGVEIEKYATTEGINRIEVVDNLIKGKDSNKSIGISMKGKEQIKALKVKNNSYSNTAKNYSSRVECDKEPSVNFLRVVSNEKVNLYESRSTSSKVVGTLAKNLAFNVADSIDGDGWYEVMHNGNICYLKSNIVRLAESTNGIIDLPKTYQYLELKSGKSDEHLTLKKIKDKDKVKILYYDQNSWSKVVYNDVVGYINGLYLKQEKTDSSINSTNTTISNTNQNNTNSTATNDTNKNDTNTTNNAGNSTIIEEVGVITGTNVNFRSEANTTNSNVIQKLNIGDKVIIVSKDNKNWLKVRYNNNVGYINSDYVSTNTNIEAGIIIGTNVNFRTEPNTTSSKVIQKLNIGDKVAIESKDNKDWFRIKYKSKVGYISSKYISTESNIEIGTIIGTNVNFRTEPNTTNSTVIQKLNTGNTAIIESKDNKDWIKIRYDNKVGYVNSKYITIK